jgi:hypothetical protein
MPIFTVSADALQRLGSAVIEKLAFFQRRADRDQTAGKEVAAADQQQIEQLSKLLNVLKEAGDVGGFDPRITLEILERVAKGPTTFLWVRGSGAQEDVQHAVRLCQCDAFAGSVTRHGVQATGALTERGQALLEVLRCWSLPVPVTAPR